MVSKSADAGLAGRPTSRGGWLNPLIDTFSNIWFGIFLLVLLFLYCSIGSAVPAMRQMPGLEMTEFEWFHWWPFDVLVVLFCVTLVTVTVRRIPLRLMKAGVWMIHGGIIILCLGSYYYFGTKVEGDTPVFRRCVLINLPGLTEPRTLVALPGARTSVAVGPDIWSFGIANTNTSWPILSEPHEGERSYAVNVEVTDPKGATFVRQLLDGYPQYTEDVVPGKGRAIKNIGRTLVNADLELTLDYEPQHYFSVMDSWALFSRRLGETTWRQRPLYDLPRYHDHVGSRDLVFADHQIPLRALDLEVPPGEGPDAISSARVRVTGYLRYAAMHRQWREGGGRLNPVLRLTAPGQDGRVQQSDLAAFDPANRRREDGLMEFMWLDREDQLSALPRHTLALVTISVPGTDVALRVPVTDDVTMGRDGPFTPIEGTGFSYRIRNAFNNLAISDGTVSVALVDVRTPENTEFTRWVADRPEMTKDRRGDGDDPHGGSPALTASLDERIEMTYQPGSPPILWAAIRGGGLHLIFNQEEDRMLEREIALGEEIELVHGFTVRADALLTHAVAEERPYVYPPARRNRDVRENMAMIRLEVGSGSNIQSHWLRFAPYAFDNEQYTESGRFGFYPERFRLADGSIVEVMFSRERRRLPQPIALDNFELLTHVGGYTGSSVTIRNYVSRLRFRHDSGWTEPIPIEVNQPTEHGGLWYFQSTWDPPERDVPGSGMNHTGLGVGNRNGVGIQLAGCSIMVAGMIFTFYVKPILRRNRRDRLRRGQAPAESRDGLDELTAAGRRAASARHATDRAVTAEPVAWVQAVTNNRNP